MKIVHCIAHLTGGGAEAQLDLLVNITKNELNNTVISYQTKKCKKINYITIPQTKNIIKLWVLLLEIFNKEKPDVIHIWLPSLLHVYLIPAIIYNKAKITVGVRSAYTFESRRYYIFYLFLIFTKEIVSNTHIEDQKGAFRWLFNRKRYYYIPNAIKYSKSKNVNLLAEVKVKNLLFVGRLSKEKNIETLLKALSQITEFDYQLTIVGEGDLRQALQSLCIELSIQDRVFFEGHQNQLEDYYKKSNILILPSIREGMPNVAFEAASFNNILLLSNIPANKRWFKKSESAFFFATLDVNDLKENLLKAMSLNSIEVRSFNKNTSVILKELSLDSYKNKYMVYYNSLQE